MKNINYEELYYSLRARGEREIKIDFERGVITSQHGLHTYNTWTVINGDLKCIYCHTKY